MKTLLSETDFRGEINVPNTADSLVCAELSALIQQYEPQFFDDVLGAGLAADFYTAADATSVVDAWQKLIDGTTWTDDSSGTNVSRRHQGIRFAAARYVYWHWQRNRATLTTGVGELTPSAENGTVVSPISKQVTAWNQMVREMLNIWQFLAYYKDSGSVFFTAFDRNLISFEKFRPQNVFNL